MIAMRRLAWIAGIGALVASLGTAYGAYLLADYSWNQVVSYETPYGDYDRPWTKLLPGETPPAERVDDPEAPRLVLIMIDGLGLDASRSMTALNTLRGYGSDMVAITPQPSLSYPTWTAILSGSPPDISGVTTNWFDSAVPVETIIDVALEDGYRVGVVGPDSFGTLYLDGYEGWSALETYLLPWDEDGEYMSTGYVNAALEIIEGHSPQLLVLHLPDADETAHSYGPDSEEYRDVVGRIDTDIARFVEQVQDERTTFVITSDHGHIPGGGHGGWEDDATRVPVIMVGRGVASQRDEMMRQIDIAPTVAGLMGLRVPTHSAGHVRVDTMVDSDRALVMGQKQYRASAERYLEVINQQPYMIGGAREYVDVDLFVEDAKSERLSRDRAARVPQALSLAGVAILALVSMGMASWRALVASLAGSGAYYLVYNFAYFIVHGHEWSLSAFNTEDLVEMFFNIRMAEAAVAGLVAAGVAGIVYPLLRRRPRGPRRTYLGGWLALGPTTILAVQATLALQVAWFLWAWGADVTWRLPDLMWGFKYDLDLIQTTALGAVALLSPLVTYLIGRYHPKVRRAEAEAAELAG